MALQNEQHKKHVDTVLFFDEANTTDALGMIKEIMMDRRCNGRPLSDRLKFIVACNPYRRQVQIPSKCHGAIKFNIKEKSTQVFLFFFFEPMTMIY